MEKVYDKLNANLNDQEFILEDKSIFKSIMMKILLIRLALKLHERFIKS